MPRLRPWLLLAFLACASACDGTESGNPSAPAKDAGEYPGGSGGRGGTGGKGGGGASGKGGAGGSAGSSASGSGGAGGTSDMDGGIDMDAGDEDAGSTR